MKSGPHRKQGAGATSRVCVLSCDLNKFQGLTCHLSPRTSLRTVMTQPPHPLVSHPSRYFVCWFAGVRAV